jgi:hypothetical protein
MAGELPQAIQLEIEQLPQPQSGAAQQDDPSPGHDIVELMNGGHECSVDVGWHSSGQWCEKAGKVTAVQNQGRWPVGPTPDRDVVEEAAEVADGRARPEPATPSPACAAGVVAEEILQVGPGKLTQGADLRMMLADWCGRALPCAGGSSTTPGW